MAKRSEKLIEGVPKYQHIDQWKKIIPEMFVIPEANVNAYTRKWLDLPYTDLPDGPKLDLYLPEEGNGPFPVIVYVHGGGFLIGHKRFEFMEPLFYVLQRGYALASVDYMLSEEGEFPTPVFEIKTAIRWLREHAAEYNLATDRIAIWGDSAGGHLSAIVGTSAAAGQLEDLSLGSPKESSLVQAVVDWFGPTDFTNMAVQLKEMGVNHPPNLCNMEELFLGDKLCNVPELVVAANPATYITPNTPPIYIQHGDKDTVVPYQQSIVFAEALNKLTDGNHVYFEILEGAIHEDPRFWAKENLDKMLDFLDKYIK